MHRYLLLILSVVFSQTPVLAKTDIENKLKHELGNWINPDEPGCSVAYGKADKTYFYSLGMESISSQKYLNKHTRYHTASISKQFTSHLAIKLAQSGKLKLHQAIAEILPELKKIPRISIAQLMNHSSGLSEHWSIFELQGRTLREHYTQADAYSLITQKNFLEFEPGSQFSYSNGGYVVLSKLIERITGKSLNDNIKIWLSDRHGISAQFQINNVKEETLIPDGYQLIGDQFQGVISNSYIYGDSNLIIDITNFSRWARYLITELNKNPYYVDAIENSHKTFNYFAGLYIDNSNFNLPVLYHSGYFEHTSQSIVLLPKTKEFAIALCNRSDFRPAHITRNILKSVSAATFNTANKSSSDNSKVYKEKLGIGLYYDSLKTKTALIFSQNDDTYYYGHTVGSPGKLNRSGNKQWYRALSTKTIYVNKINDDQIEVTDPQSTTILTKVEFVQFAFGNKARILSYKNDLVGTVKFGFSSSPFIEFTDSVGKLPLRCNHQKQCFSEDGFVIVNANNESQIEVSTLEVRSLLFKLVD